MREEVTVRNRGARSSGGAGNHFRTSRRRPGCNLSYGESGHTQRTVQLKISDRKRALYASNALRAPSRPTKTQPPYGIAGRPFFGSVGATSLLPRNSSGLQPAGKRERRQPRPNSSLKPTAGPYLPRLNSTCSSERLLQSLLPNAFVGRGSSRADAFPQRVGPRRLSDRTLGRPRTKVKSDVSFSQQCDVCSRMGVLSSKVPVTCSTLVNSVLQ